MRKSTWLAIGMAALALTLGCSSDDGDDNKNNNKNNNNNTEEHVATPNGDKIMQQAACEAIVDAINAKAGELRCTVSPPLTCPDYILQDEEAVSCAMWDEGTVNECVEYIGEYTKCTDIATKPCKLTVYPDTAPTGCEDVECDPETENCDVVCDPDNDEDCEPEDVVCDPDTDEDCEPEDGACDPDEDPDCEAE